MPADATVIVASDREGPAVEDSTIRHEAREPVDLTSLYGLDNPTRIDTWELWQQRPSGTEKVPIGVTQAGTPAELTIPAVAKRNSGWGFGHGLVTGAADTRRAEVLRTIVLGLALRNSPAAVNFFFVDFHGRGTFDGLADLPHTAGLVSGVAHDLGLAARIRDRLAAECNRRLEVFEIMGNFGDLEHYERARTAGFDLAPVPTLIVVIDGIAELVAQQPEFRMLLVTYGRIGRAIGAHLVLAAQQPAEAVTPELPSYLAYHIVLGTLPADVPQSVPAGAGLHPATAEQCYLHTGSESVQFEPVRLSPVTGPGGNTGIPLLEVLVAQMHWDGSPALLI
ncbi:FtsK/SpoIIIE domain-containing protein [Nocardia sp. NPDC024068]|uniref:FtsK/SpoIIIE domain-containing protein n=1 Tax=Nocardia sp. NPDC024068 TaxID=3157197 RepID=UPI0033FEE607